MFLLVDGGLIFFACLLWVRRVPLCVLLSVCASYMEEVVSSSTLRVGAAVLV